MDLPNHDSWKNWFQLYGPKLLCARVSGRARPRTPTCVQEAFIRFWRHQRGLPGKPMALLVTSVRRAAFEMHHRVARETRVCGLEEREQRYFAVPWNATSAALQSKRRCSRIPPEQREVLVLKIWGELTLRQIAFKLGFRPTRAASRYRYALAALRSD